MVRSVDALQEMNLDISLQSKNINYRAVIRRKNSLVLPLRRKGISDLGFRMVSPEKRRAHRSALETGSGSNLDSCRLVAV